MELIDWDIEQTELMVLAWCRLAAICLTLPRLGTDRYMSIYRLLLATAVCVCCGPLLIANGTTSLADLETGAAITTWFSLAIGEISIGLMLGIAASAVLVGLFAAGQIVSQFLGFQIGSLQQGISGEDSTDYRKFFFVAAVVLWFGVGSHRLLMQGVLDSFALFPAGQAHLSLELFVLMNQSVQAALEFSIRFALPVIVIGLMGLGVSGFVQRVVGANQTVSVGFMLNQILAFGLLPMLLWGYEGQLLEGTIKHFESVIAELSDLAVRVSTKSI